MVLLSGCAPFLPDNYLSPRTVHTPQKINGHWVSPRVIPINVTTLGTSEGRALLEPAMRPQPYQIGPYDNLNVIVWGHPDLSTIATSPAFAATTSNNNIQAALGGVTNPAVLVQSDGTIFFPYVGHLKVAGLTTQEAQKSIAQRLSAYIRNPQVTVQVAKFRNRNIYVLGEVKSPGLQQLTDKPLTLMEAISSAGGINPGSADPTHIYVVRGAYQRLDIFSLNAQTPQALLIAEKFPLQENDIVYVSAATLNAWNQFIGTVLPSFSTYFTIKGLAS